MGTRVRFAPSPTGDLHIGSVRTALYNFLFARHEKATFVLRIEDTDQKRNKEEALRGITDGLAWAGLTWDEGPVFQSDRLDLYAECARRLEASGRAYWRDDPGKGRALVFRIDRRKIGWDDLVHGPSARDISADPDLVIVKSDGFPTYNFACVVDDHDMNITHVLRGDEHFANTPKQISLYRALEWAPPVFGHMPLILDPDGEKLSKRKMEKYANIGLPVVVEECRRLGYLPEAVVNFVALLGWSPGHDIELMTLDEMIRAFTPERINTTPARFLVDKLLWMNGMYIRRCALDRLTELSRPYIESAYGPQPPEKIREAVRQQQERLKRLDELALSTRFVFASRVEYDPKAVEKWLEPDGARALLAEVRKGLAAMHTMDKEGIEALLGRIVQEHQTKLGHVAQPLRVAVTGGTVSPPIHDTLEILGRDTVLARIDHALEIAGSKK
ncbi:MAG: glutamate--tRNA ligase [Planctomycetes bacterium]|nr:glutamate--tRNA ligase [Planctomycetota bacterium]